MRNIWIDKLYIEYYYYLIFVYLFVLILYEFYEMNGGIIAIIILKTKLCKFEGII